MKYLCLFFFLFSIGAYAQTVTNIDNSITNWKSPCALESCDPGGVNPPGSVTQTAGNATPSLDGNSMLLSVTTIPGSSMQTNVLFPYLSPVSCDLCTSLSTTASFYLSANAGTQASSIELDDNNFDKTENYQITCAHQCNQVTHLWQIANGVNDWVNTSVACNLTDSTWHTYVSSCHRIIGDTSCGGYPTLHFDALVIDGTNYPINQTLCAEPLPSNYSAALIPQFQIDIGAESAATTVSMNIDEVSFTATSANASTVIVPMNATQAQIVSSIASVESESGTGNIVQFQAGSTSTLTSAVTVPCDKGLVLSGPAITPNAANGMYFPTATIQAASITGTFNLFKFVGCTSQDTVQYLHFANASALYVEAPSMGVNYQGPIIQFNQFTGVPSTQSSTLNPAIVLIADTVGPTGSYINNTKILHNNFGDAGSCETPVAIMENNTVTKGECAAVYASTQGNSTNFLYNNVTHMEEGFKWACNEGTGIATACNPASNAGLTVTNVNAQFNDFNAMHRMAIEWNFQPNNSAILGYNSYHDNYKSYTGSGAYSVACCVSSGSYGAGLVNNTTVANNPATFTYINFADELWGNGSTANAEFIFGYFNQGITWGQGGTSGSGTHWGIYNNDICGTAMAANNSYITSEAYAGQTAPIITGNDTSQLCTAFTSFPPTVSPSAGLQNFPVTVTITGGTNAYEQTYWYTIDGSTPVPGQGSTLPYTLPFTLAAPATVKTIGMWGAPNQPYVWPSVAALGGQLGWVASPVISTAYTMSSSVTLSAVTLTTTGGNTTLPVGIQNQLIANCLYSDGTKSNCTVVDSQGNVATITSSNTGVGTLGGGGTNCITAAGCFTAVAAGSTTLTASVAGLGTNATLPITVSNSGVSAIALSGNSSVFVGSTVQLKATCTYPNGSTTDCTSAVSAWSSVYPTIASINSTGLVTGIASGQADFTATIGSTSSPQFAVTVTSTTATYSSSYVVSASSIYTIPVAGTLSFQAYCKYSDNTVDNCTATDAHGIGVATNGWRTSNSSVMSVSANTGVYTGVAAGSANASAVLSNSATTTTSAVTVTTSAVTLSSVTLTAANTNLQAGNKIVLTATCGYSDSTNTNCSTIDSHGNDASFVSSNTGVAVVDANGNLTAVATGMANITASIGNVTSSALAINVTFNGITQIQGLQSQGLVIQ
jgi:hypothetical protein